MNLYKELWSRIGGRPWTYIIRDTWHKFEWFWIAGLMALGGWTAATWGLPVLFEGLAVFTVGYIFGHFFWGTQWQPGQKGE